MLVVVVVGLCRHAVEIGDGFSCKRSNGKRALELAGCEESRSRSMASPSAVDREGECVLRRVDGIVYESHVELSMVLHMLGFRMCFVGMYVLTSLFLSVGDAENLSLLTSDTYGRPTAAHSSRQCLYVCIPYGASSSGGVFGVTVVLFSGVAVYVVGGCVSSPEGKASSHDDFEEIMRSCEASDPYNGA